MHGEEAALTPTQAELLERLGAAYGERPTFDPALAGALRDELTARLEPVAARVPGGDTLWLSKHRTEAIVGCEVRFLDEEARPFEWSPATARGSVAHKAIEILTMRPDRLEPLEAVQEAEASLMAGTTSLGEWLQGCSETMRAEVRSEANSRVAAFCETFPPLRPAWRPVLEGSIRAELRDGAIVLSGRPDLTIGRAQGDRAGKVIIDFKTGRGSPGHVADLRFYALVDTLRVGVPPRLLATAYLDRGQLFTEDVTEGHLWATVDRVVDAAGRLVTLQAGERDPVLVTGPPCRWCRQRGSCEAGRAYLADADPEELDPLG